MSSTFHKTNISTNLTSKEIIKKFEKEYKIISSLNTNQIDKLDYFTIQSIIYDEYGNQIGYAKIFQKYILEYKHKLKYSKEYTECSIFELEEFYIEPNYRNIGLGSEMLQNIINLCKIAQIQENTNDIAIELEIYNKYKESDEFLFHQEVFKFFNNNSFRVNYPYAIYSNIEESIKKESLAIA